MVLFRLYKISRRLAFSEMDTLVAHCQSTLSSLQNAFVSCSQKAFSSQDFCNAFFSYFGFKQYESGLSQYYLSTFLRKVEQIEPQALSQCLLVVHKSYSGFKSYEVEIMEKLIEKRVPVPASLIGTLFHIYYNSTDSPRQQAFNTYLLA